MRGCKTRCNFARQVTKQWRFPSKHDRIQLAPNSERETAQNSNSKKGTWIIGLGPWFLCRHIFPARPHCRCKQPATQRSWNEKNRVCESGSLFKKVKRCTAPGGPTSWFVPGFLCSVSLSTPPNFSTSSKSEETHKGIGLAAFEIKRIQVHWLLKTLIPTGLLRSHTFPSSGFVTRTSLWPGRCGQKLTRNLDKQGADGFYLFSGIVYYMCIYICVCDRLAAWLHQRAPSKCVYIYIYVYIYMDVFIAMKTPHLCSTAELAWQARCKKKESELEVRTGTHRPPLPLSHICQHGWQDHEKHVLIFDYMFCSYHK